MDLGQLSDRAEITDLVIRYTRMVDTRRWDALDAVFTPEATIDYTAMGGIAGGVEEIKRYLSETMPFFSSTLHMLGLPAIDLDGDRAGAVTPCHNPMVMGTGPSARLMVCSLWYHHRFVRTPDGWRISDLREEKCHMSFVGTSPL